MKHCARTELRDACIHVMTEMKTKRKHAEEPSIVCTAEYDEQLQELLNASANYSIIFDLVPGDLV